MYEIVANATPATDSGDRPSAIQNRPIKQILQDMEVFVSAHATELRNRQGTSLHRKLRRSKSKEMISRVLVLL